MDGETVPAPLRLAAGIAWRVLVVAAAVVVVAFIVAKLRIIAIPFFVALLITTQLSPVVDWIETRGAPGAARPAPARTCSPPRPAAP